MTNSKSVVSSAAPWLALTAIITFQLLLIVLILIRPDLDPSWHTISEWAIGPYGWVMSLAFLISAVSYGCLFVALRSVVESRSGRVGLGLLLICFVGTVGVGIFTTDPLDAKSLTIRGTLHIIFGTTALVLLPFAALLINLSLGKKPGWASARRILRWTAGLPLLGFVGFVVYTIIFVVPLGPHAYGPGVHIGWPPRFAFFTYAVWLITLSWETISVRRVLRTADSTEGRTHRI